VLTGPRRRCHHCRRFHVLRPSPLRGEDSCSGNHRSPICWYVRCTGRRIHYQPQMRYFYAPSPARCSSAFAGLFGAVAKAWLGGGGGGGGRAGEGGRRRSNSTASLGNARQPPVGGVAAAASLRRRSGSVSGGMGGAVPVGRAVPSSKEASKARLFLSEFMDTEPVSHMANVPELPSRDPLTAGLL
jgi:hypothetical protein